MKTQIDKSEALKLVAALSDAAVRHYKVVNGHARGNADKAATKEIKVAQKVLTALGVDATAQEIQDACN